MKTIFLLQVKCIRVKPTDLKTQQETKRACECMCCVRSNNINNIQIMFIYLICFALLCCWKTNALFIYLFICFEETLIFPFLLPWLLPSTSITTTAGFAASSSSLEFKCTKLSNLKQQATRHDIIFFVITRQEKKRRT